MSLTSSSAFFRSFQFALICIVVFATVGTPSHVIAQRPTFSIDVKVVNVLATVRDSEGHLISDLSKDDFLLYEDGRPQVIKYFSKASDAPLSLGLLLDTSESEQRVLDLIRTASNDFLGGMLRSENDVAFVVRFDWGVDVLQKFTPSHLKLQKALQRVQGRRRFSLLSRKEYREEQRCGYPGTLFYDALVTASKKFMGSRNGRKALIAVTDGADQGSCHSLDEAIEVAQRADTLIYGIFIEDEQYGGRHHPDARTAFARLCNETGGRLFVAKPPAGHQKTYAAIQDELRNQYNLGYSSDRSNDGPSYRRIRVITRQPSLIVQARDGYYAR